MKKVKFFEGDFLFTIEKEIEAFLGENPKIKIISSSMSCIKYDFAEYCILIIYEEDE